MRAVAAVVAGADGAGALIEQTTLASGLRIVTERMPEALSVTLGFWARVGGRDEDAAVQGASHFLEHLLFKGTERRTARQIAEAVDAVGGEMNAFTAQEHTAYYARLPRRHLLLGLDVLSDVVTRPAFREAEVDAERQVILEELHLAEDEPDERVHTLAHEALFPHHPLGREVLGTLDTIAGMTRDQIGGFFADQYRPSALVLVAAGDLEHASVVDAVADRFTRGTPRPAPVRTPPTMDPVPVAVLHRDTEQAHLAVAWRAFDLHDEDRYPLAVLNQVLGGGLSSRLFQQIREVRGLAYSVYSYTSLYHDAGLLAAYAGTGPDKVAEVRRLLDAEVDALRADGISAHELTVARGYLEGSMVLGLEDSASRMARLGSNLVGRGEVTDLEQHLAAIRNVTLDDVDRVIARVLGAPRTTCLVGPCAEADAL